MAASSGLIGKGTSLGYSDTQGGSYTSVGEVIDVAPPDEAVANDIELTHYLSDNDTIEYKPGWNEPGESTFQINFVPAQYQTLRLLKGVTKWWKITYHDGSFEVTQAYIKRLSKAVPIKDRITATITLRTSGATSFSAAS